MIESLLSGSVGAAIAVMAERHFFGQARKDKEREEKIVLNKQLALMERAITTLTETMKELSSSLKEHVSEIRSEFQRRDEQILTIERRLGVLSGLSEHTRNPHQ